MAPPSNVEFKFEGHTPHPPLNSHPWASVVKVNDNKFIFTQIHILRHGWGYGGCTASVALYAAARSVPARMFCASFQAQFIRPVTESKLIVEVERCRDSSAEKLRLVRVYSNGQLALRMDCRFTARNEAFTSAPETPHKFPTVKSPEESEESHKLFEEFTEGGGDIRLARNVVFPEDQPFVEHRLPTGLDGIIGPNRPEYSHLLWSRYTFPDDGSDEHFKQLMITFLSDLGMCYAPCRIFPGMVFKRVASLSLSMWFHTTQVDSGDFLLQDHETVAHNHNRAVTAGRIWSRNGKLVASSLQESIVEKGEILSTSKL